MSWYRTGTVTVTAGSKNVTGVGTLWASSVNVGDAFALVDANGNTTGAWYEVETVTSNTALVLKQTYTGTPAPGSNKQYAVFNLVGNMTTPSFAQRLAQFFDQFQDLVDLPTTTPTASSIPIAGAGGTLAAGWLPAATTSAAGAVELATSAEAAAGVDTNPAWAVTPAGALALLNKFGVGGTVLASSDADLNTMKVSGLYLCANTSANLPVAFAFFLEVYARHSNWVLQRVVATDGIMAFSRYWNGTVWTAWTPIPIGTTPTAQTLAVASDADATSATAAPLKSAGGLAVAKKGIFGQGIGFGNSSTSSPDVTGTTKVRKIQVFDASGNSIGYLQVYQG